MAHRRAHRRAPRRHQDVHPDVRIDVRIDVCMDVCMDVNTDMHIQGAPLYLSGACIRRAGAHNSALYAYYETKIPAIERSRFDHGAPIFYGPPALIPDLIFPVEAGIGGGPTEPQQHLFFKQ